MASEGQIHYRLEGTVGDSTMNTKLLLNQWMSDMRMVNAIIDTVEVVRGKLMPIEGTLDEAAAFNLRSITKKGTMPEIMSPCFFLENGTTHLYMDLQRLALDEDSIRFLNHPSGTPLNEDFGTFQNAFSPLVYGDSVRQQRLDNLMRSELNRHNDDVLGLVELAMVLGHKPLQTATWLDLMSPRIKAGDVWNQMKLALSSMGIRMESSEAFFSPNVGEKFVDFAVKYDGKTTRLSDYVGRGHARRFLGFVVRSLPWGDSQPHRCLQQIQGPWPTSGRHCSMGRTKSHVESHRRGPYPIPANHQLTGDCHQCILYPCHPPHHPICPRWHHPSPQPAW